MPRARRPPCRFREEIDSDHDADIDGSQDDGGLQEEVNEDDEGIKHTKAYACETCHYKKSGENSRSYCTGRQCKDSEDFDTVMQICPIWQIGNTNAFQRKHPRAWAAYKNAEKKAKVAEAAKEAALKKAAQAQRKQNRQAIAARASAGAGLVGVSNPPSMKQELPNSKHRNKNKLPQYPFIS
jgi:hypothetical protein